MTSLRTSTARRTTDLNGARGSRPRILRLPVVASLLGNGVRAALALSFGLVAPIVQTVHAQTPVTLPFDTDFESGEGYTLGPLAADTYWQFGSGLDADILSPGAGSSQALGFSGGDWLWLSTDSQGAQVSWVDFYTKPVFVEPFELPEIIETEQSAVTGFVKVNTQGEVYAIDGDGFGGGSWVPSGELRNLQGDASADWIRLTYRLDYAAKTWDLFVDGEMVMVDLGFLDQSVPDLDSFSVRADGENPTLLDYFYAGNDNPLYIDTSNDGLPDAWLTAQGLSIYSDQRSGDSDLDGLNNLLEYQIASQAGNPDSDGDGVNDGAEYFAGADPTAASAYSLSALPFLESFESYSLGSLGSQGNWTVAGETAEIQATEVWAGSAALSLGGDSSASNMFDGSGQSVVWIDLYVKPTAAAESPELAGDTAVGYYFNEEGRPTVFDGSGGNGSGFWRLLDAARSSDWRRVTVKMNYSAQAYDFYLDGERLGAGLGFAHAQPFISRITASGSTALDDISVDSVEPAGLDDDRDGSTNAEETAAGTDPLAFDSDGDGLADSLELLWGLDPTVADATLAQPVESSPGIHVWTTSFAASEGYTASTLAGQNDWAASGLAEVTADETASVTDDPAADASLERFAGMGEERRVWISFRAKLITGDLPVLGGSPEPFAAAFGAASASTLAVWDDANGDWNALPTSVELTEWNEYALYLDYVDKAWTLCLNGVIVAEGLPFHDEDLTTFSRFKALQASRDPAELSEVPPEGETGTVGAFFDDIRFANTEPADMDFDGDGLLNDQERQLGSDLYAADSDVDGMDDLWEYQNGLDLLTDDSNADPDGDGLQNLDEYAFGLNPSLQDAEGVQGFASLELWHGVQGAYLSNLTNDSRFPLNPDYFTFLEELTTEYNTGGLSTYGQRIHGTMTAPVSGSYTFWVSGDARVEFWLSTDDTPFGKELLAELKEATGFQQWNKYASQVSRTVELVEGQSYYFEVLHTEGSGKDHVSVAWQYPGQSRQVVPGEYLTSAVSYANDLDEDGLPDDWEVSVGLDPSKGYGVNGYAGDPDGDTLLNYQESSAGTSPFESDSDGDGYDDWYEINELLTDPTVAEEVQWVESQRVDGAEAEFLTGDWARNNGVAVCRTAGGGSMSMTLNVASSGIKQLTCDFTRVADTANSEDRPVILLWYLDGEYLGKTEQSAEDGVLSFSALKRSPYILSGEHTLTLHWLNVYRDRKLSIDSLLVESPVASSVEVLNDWTEERVQQYASLDSLPGNSLVSPICIEGDAQFLSAVSISPVASPTRGGLGRWYADVNLNPDDVTVVSVSLQNGAVIETNQVDWLTTNLLNHDDLTLRTGDSLKLSAIPEGTSGGEFDLLINGQLVDGSVSDYSVYHFENAGLYSVTGVYTAGDGSTSTGTMEVNVVQMPDSIDPIAIWVGRHRSWSIPNQPVGLILEASGMSLTPDGSGYSLQRDEPYEEVSVVARLEESGAILGSIPTHPFSLRATVEGYLQAQEIDDTTREIENEIFTFGLPEDVSVKIEVFKAGVVLDDGTRSRYLGISDFDEVGKYSFYMIKPDSVNGGSCHRIKAYQNSTYIGTR